MPDPLSAQYSDLLEGTCDCVDRIVLNGPQLAIAAHHRDFHRASTFPMAYVSILFSSCLNDAMLE
jgi:hypothetical protein